jgi:hypothetical protein
MDTDTGLCSDELAKLSALIRVSDKQANSVWVSSARSSVDLGTTTPAVLDKPANLPAVGHPSIMAEVFQLLLSLNRGDVGITPSAVLRPFMTVVVDPHVSGHVTADSLGGIYRLLQLGHRSRFLDRIGVTGPVIDCVTATRFTETDRLSDESVLLRIIRIVEFVLVEGAPLDKARVAAGLQCIQTIWVQDMHTYVLRDAARMAVYKILRHVIENEKLFSGYAPTLIENVCLNCEFIAKQPPSLFDADKLAFFVDIISFISRIGGDGAVVPFQVMNGLFWLVPPGPAAALVDPASTGILQRPSAANALPVAACLINVGNGLIRSSLQPNATLAAPLLIEALITGLYLRPLCPALEGSDVKLKGFGETAISIIEKRIAAQAQKNYVPDTSSIQLTLLEGLGQLFVEPNFILTLWESFDAGAWQRGEICSALIDSLVSVALAKCSFSPGSLSKDSTGADKFRKVFDAIQVAGSVSTDNESVETVESFALPVLVMLMDNVARSEDGGSDGTATQLLMRHRAREIAGLMKEKPKKTAEYVTKFVEEFKEDLNPPANAVPWALRLITALDFESLGEFFGQPTEASAKSLSDFIKSLNLKEMDPEQALRACLQSFRLPGEAQQIDRIIKEIAYEYYNSQGDSSKLFASADAAYTFLFSVIMLNTDQHNPQVKKRMELKDFLRNNRKINEGEDIDESVQVRVFNSIRNSQIVTPKSASWFCAPLKGRWRDLVYLHESGYLPSKICRPMSHSASRFLAAKGNDVLLVAAVMLANGSTKAPELVGRVAGAALSALEQSPVEKGIVTSIATDAIGLLKRYAIESFGTLISGIVPNARSFACLKILFELKSNDAFTPLLSARAVLVGLYSPYALLGDSSVLGISEPFKRVLTIPSIGTGDSTVPGASVGGLSFLKGLLWDTPATPNSVASPKNMHSDHEEGNHHHTADSLTEMSLTENWREENLRSSFVSGQPNAPPAAQVEQLKSARIEEWIIREIDQNPAACITLVKCMLELLSEPSKQFGGDFWAKEIIRSSPWVLLTCVQILDQLYRGSDMSELRASAESAISATFDQIKSAVVLSDPRGVKLSVFSIFAFTRLFASGEGESSWSIPLFETLAVSSSKSSSLVVCMSIRDLLENTSPEWLANGCPWKHVFKVLVAVCPSKSSDKIMKKIALQTAYRIVSLPSFHHAAEEDIAECILSYEQMVGLIRGPGRVSKTLSEVACHLAGQPGSGPVWSAILARITLRVTTVANQKNPTGAQLSDSVELLRMCLGDPRAVQALTTAEAASTIERTANALSAIVSADTPPGALQTALSVYMRFFLLSLDRLQNHDQFEHLWLGSLRIILLFIKRGNDDAEMEQLAEIAIETMRNALQVLLASNLLKFEDENTESPAWWKVTWESVETFCPGMLAELGFKPEEADAVQPVVEVAPQAAEIKSDDLPIAPESENQPIEDSHPEPAPEIELSEDCSI